MSPFGPTYDADWLIYYCYSQSHYMSQFISFSVTSHILYYGDLSFKIIGSIIGRHVARITRQWQQCRGLSYEHNSKQAYDMQNYRSHSTLFQTRWRANIPIMPHATAPVFDMTSLKWSFANAWTLWFCIRRQIRYKMSLTTAQDGTNKFTFSLTVSFIRNKKIIIKFLRKLFLRNLFYCPIISWKLRNKPDVYILCCR